MKTQTYADPATVGLAGYGLASLLLQFFNLGWLDEGPAIYIGAVFGGLVQLIAGFQFFRLGDTFGYTVFISYGVFWITLPLILISNHFGLFVSAPKDMAILLAGWVLLSFLFTIVAIQLNRTLALMFLFVLGGMIMASLASAGLADTSKISAVLFILSALMAWYIMLGNLLKELTGREVLPLGAPLVQMKRS